MDVLACGGGAPFTHHLGVKPLDVNRRKLVQRYASKTRVDLLANLPRIGGERRRADGGLCRIFEPTFEIFGERSPRGIDQGAVQGIRLEPMELVPNCFPRRAVNRAPFAAAQAIVSGG